MLPSGGKGNEWHGGSTRLWADSQSWHYCVTTLGKLFHTPVPSASETEVDVTTDM